MFKQWCGVNVTDAQLNKIKGFEQKHMPCTKGKGLLEIIVRPLGFGASAVIRCIECGEDLDITDSDLW